MALRLRLRLDLVDLVDAGAAFDLTAAGQADTHAETYLADQTYLQHAQPSTFGHDLLAFADPVLRDVERLRRELDWVNRSPGGRRQRQRRPAAVRRVPGGASSDSGSARCWRDLSDPEVCCNLQLATRA